MSSMASPDAPLGVGHGQVQVRAALVDGARQGQQFYIAIGLVGRWRAGPPQTRLLKPRDARYHAGCAQAARLRSRFERAA